MGGNTRDVISHQSIMITNDIIDFLNDTNPKNVWNLEIYD